MRWWGTQKQVTCADLLDKYAAVLERGPEGTGTLYTLDTLPAEKPLMKAAIIAQAHELGPSALETFRAAFVSLASFQQDAREPPQKHFEVAAEMTVLRLEFDARTKSLREEAHAQVEG